ncbi:MAG: DUF6152 family protein [Bryobacteraceae bacterium]|jgi:hypothetical protein
MKAKVAVSLAGLLLLALPMLAHHSFAAEYDSTKPVTLKGTVTKFDWVNPHSRLFVDVKDDSGKVTAWEFETGNPTSMQRNGWKRDTLKPGDQVVVTGFRAKDGANIAAASSVSTPDGKKLLAGSNNTPTQ